MKFLTLILLVASANAQMFPFPGPKNGSGGAPPSYVGPGDITFFQVWWGLRAYSAATAGTKAVNLCDAADAHCADALTNATTGILTIPSSNPNCTGSACTVKTIYDQSGNLLCSAAACDLTQTTIALRPTFVASCTSSLPCMRFTGSSSQAFTDPNLTSVQAHPITFSSVSQETTTASYEDVFAGNSGAGSTQAGYLNAFAFTYAGNNVGIAAAATSTYHAIQSTFNAGSSTIYIDGTSTGVADPGSNGVQAMNIGGSTNTGNYLTGEIKECGMISGTVTGGTQASLNTNQHTFWVF